MPHWSITTSENRTARTRAAAYYRSLIQARENSVAKRTVDEEKRRKELLAAPKAEEADAAPRVTIQDGIDRATRIEVADSAAVRPGKY